MPNFYKTLKSTNLIYRIFTSIAISGFWHPRLFPQENKVFIVPKLGKSSGQYQGNPDFLHSLTIIF
jgi:hypothetical protein